jgi:hypothetical protein
VYLDEIGPRPKCRLFLLRRLRGHDRRVNSDQRERDPQNRESIMIWTSAL